MRIRNLHPWNVTVKEAKEIQLNLSKRINLENHIREIRYIAGCDVSFDKETSYAAISIHDYKTLELVEEQSAKDRIRFPYIAGLLTFREGPVLLKALSKIKRIPDIFIFDGQGIAHPLNMGIATHMGLLLNKPTIGCAKSLLYGSYQEPANEFGSYSRIKDEEGKTIGVALRTREDVKPVFVSCGFKVDLEASIYIILSCTDRYRLPEVMRSAHHLSQKVKKDDTLKR